MSGAFSFRAKNGQVEIGSDGQIRIGRKGWFGLLYQTVMRSPTEFDIEDVQSIQVKAPALTRGYIKFCMNSASSTVWLTNSEMTGMQRK